MRAQAVSKAGNKDREVDGGKQEDKESGNKLISIFQGGHFFSYSIHSLGCFSLYLK